jgi:antitoxin VapB
VPINIKNSDVEQLVNEVTRITGETKTEAIRKALEERKDRLQLRVAGGNRRARILRFLEREVWPAIPKEERGRVLSKAEEESILGYGGEGF